MCRHPFSNLFAVLHKLIGARGYSRTVIGAICFRTVPVPMLASLVAMTFAALGAPKAGAQSQSELPPGILYCRDREIRLLYAGHVAETGDKYSYFYDRMRGSGSGFNFAIVDPVFVRLSSRESEPAVHVLNIQSSRNSSGLHVESPAMASFVKGLEGYYDAWVRSGDVPLDRTKNRNDGDLGKLAQLARKAEVRKDTSSMRWRLPRTPTSLRPTRRNDV